MAIQESSSDDDSDASDTSETRALFASGPMQWLMKQRADGVNPREVLVKLRIDLVCLVSGIRRQWAHLELNIVDTCSLMTLRWAMTMTFGMSRSRKVCPAAPAGLN